MSGAPIRTRGPDGFATLWDRSRPGRRASTLPELDVPSVEMPAEHAREAPPVMPELGELELVRHYTRLAQMNYGVDTGFYPLGSCTMKYNPKVAEAVASDPRFARLHPLQPEATVQGTLEVLWELERAICEITGMDRATLQPPAGACGELAGLLMMRAYHADRGRPRTSVLIPDSAHGTNPASVRLAGFEAVSVKSDDRGLVDVGSLEDHLDEGVAGLMLTNPNTLGLFERDIERIARLVHDAGGLLYYDGANLNAILGRCRPGDMGFDIVHVNTHKTFATPHGGGGPGAGPVGVVERLESFLPSPMLARTDDGALTWDVNRPKSIGRLHGFHGNVGVLVRALVYVLLHGAEGLRDVSGLATLNANYLAALLREALPLAYSAERPMHEFVTSAAAIKRRTGIRAMDIAKRLIDLGFHPPTVYFPLVVEEALMVEPTETETKETLDAFADAARRAVDDASGDPSLARDAPMTTSVRRLDEARAARHLQLRWTNPSN